MQENQDSQKPNPKPQGENSVEPVFRSADFNQSTEHHTPKDHHDDEQPRPKRATAFPEKAGIPWGRIIGGTFIALMTITGFWSYQVSQPEHFEKPRYIAQGHEIIDIANGLVWLRCVGGMQWNGTTCVGKAMTLNNAQAQSMVPIAREQLKDSKWRLPTRAELLSTVCQDCISIKISEKYFPNTPLGSFWTGEKNTVNPRYYWSVNYMTGHSYGRYAPSQEMYIRLVKDR